MGAPAPDRSGSGSLRKCSVHNWFEYDETQGDCQLCERARLRGEPAAPRPNDWIGESTPVPAPGPQPSAYPPPPQSPVEIPAEPTAAPFSTIGLVKPYTPPPPPAAASFEPGPPPERGFDPAPPPERRFDPPPLPEAPPATPLSDEDSHILGQLAQLKENGTFTILLLGFFAGGKTWFLNRVKHELEAEGYNVSPPPPRNRTPVGRTNVAEIHHVRRNRGQVEPFAIVDIPGERLRDLVDKNYSSIRSVLAAMEMCNAMIVALPADEVLLSEDVSVEADRLGGAHEVLLARTRNDPELHALALRAAELVRDSGAVDTAISQRRGDEESSETDRRALEMLDRVNRLIIADADLAAFTHDVCFMTGLVSKLRQVGSLADPGFDFRAIDPAMVNLHIGSRDYVRFSRPTFVALTKADLISHPDPLIAALIRNGREQDISETFHYDPLDTLHDMRPSLAAQFREWLQNVKFDFVTAFHQHDPHDTRINYNARHFGIRAVFGWISKARSWDVRPRRERMAEQRARRIRDLRDGRRRDSHFDFMKRGGAWP
jgi:hypothetical protein